MRRTYSGTFGAGNIACRVENELRVTVIKRYPSNEEGGAKSGAKSEIEDKPCDDEENPQTSKVGGGPVRMPMVERMGGERGAGSVSPSGAAGE